MTQNEEFPLSGLTKDDELNGQKSGSIVGVIRSSAVASMDARKETASDEDRRDRRRADDLLFFELLRLGELDAFVAETVFGGMSDFDVSAIVTQIEQETGLDFERYAHDILKSDFPERDPSEAIADHQRRVLIAIADEVLSDDLSIKPGYENDPVARIVSQDARYREALAFVDRANAAGVDGDLAQLVTETANAGYDVARVLGRDLIDGTLSNIATASQDRATDATLSSDLNEADPFGALASAARDLNIQWNAAAPPPAPEPTPVGVAHGPKP